MRIAPDGGYDFGPKRHYRRNIWATFREKAVSNGWPRGLAPCLLMPSIEGDEIDVALEKGFHELHVVDDNPAIVATLKKRYSHITTYGVDIVRAAERVRAAGVRLCFANLDLCGQASKKLSKTLAGFTKAKCLDSIAYVAVTMLRGRENGDTQDYCDRIVSNSQAETARRQWSQLAHLNDEDFRRAMFIGLHLATDGSTILNATNPVRADVYKSSNGQTMLWSIWQVRRR